MSALPEAKQTSRGILRLAVVAAALGVAGMFTAAATSTVDDSANVSPPAANADG